MNIPNELAHQVSEVLILYHLRELGNSDRLNTQGIAVLLSLQSNYTAEKIKEVTDRYVEAVLEGENG